MVPTEYTFSNLEEGLLWLISMLGFETCESQLVIHKNLNRLNFEQCPMDTQTSFDGFNPMGRLIFNFKLFLLFLHSGVCTVVGNASELE